MAELTLVNLSPKHLRAAATHTVDKPTQLLALHIHILTHVKHLHLSKKNTLNCFSVIHIKIWFVVFNIAEHPIKKINKWSARLILVTHQKSYSRLHQLVTQYFMIN